MLKFLILRFCIFAKVFFFVWSISLLLCHTCKRLLDFRKHFWLDEKREVYLSHEKRESSYTILPQTKVGLNLSSFTFLLEDVSVLPLYLYLQYGRTVTSNNLHEKQLFVQKKQDTCGFPCISKLKHLKYILGIFSILIAKKHEFQSAYKFPFNLHPLLLPLSGSSGSEWRRWPRAGWPKGSPELKPPLKNVNLNLNYHNS